MFEPQSGSVQGIAQMPSNTDTTAENIKFNDQMQAYVQVMEGDVDPTRTLNDAMDLPLSSFFQRPVKIHEQEWLTGSIAEFDINPWQLFFENPRVINRIANYKLLRSKLHIKIVINGNGFHYGRALVAYQPLAAFDGLSEFTQGADTVQLSQMPHIFLNPTNSTGGEIECPFFYPTNYLDIPENGWRNMGMLRCRTLNSLKHANGASDKVTITVFAWAEDVKLSVLTSVDPSSLAPQGLAATKGFEPQSGEIDEANAKGVVSGPATTLAKLSNAAAAIPAIRPFAMATSQVAGAVAGAAKALGYSRPNVTKNPEPYRPTIGSQLATTTTPDTALKMTVDDKQELTIDPRIAGISGDDQLCIKALAKRESYLVSFPWAIGDAPETLLWNSRITPVTWREGGTGQTAYYRFPACAFAALPFKYWTGTINFRFQVVASSFHKGRLKITYDPDHVAAEEYNTNHTQIIDIADKQDFTISIGNGQVTTLLDHAYPGLAGEEEVHSTTRLTTDEHGNGVIAISVLNELTSPDSVSNNDIELNVFVSAGDDFEVFVPDNHFQSFVFKPYINIQTSSQCEDFHAQSGSEMVPDSIGDQQLDAPQQMSEDRVGPLDQDLSMVNKVFTGESITSFRQMLKRYNLHRRQTYGTATGAREVYLQQNMYPYLRGAVAGAIDIATGSIPYTYCNTLLLHWVTAGFAGWRGAIRCKLHHAATLPTGIAYNSEANHTRTIVERHPFLFDADQHNLTVDPQTVVADGTLPVNIIKSQANELTGRYAPTGVNGAVLADESINPIVEFESPFYSRFRFDAGKPYNVTDGNLYTEGWTAYMSILLNPTTFTDMYYATGEDFQVYFYTGLPRMYYEADPPPPPAPAVAGRPEKPKAAPEQPAKPSFFKKII